MSFFGKNIKKIRSVKNLSQQAFANLFKIKRAGVGAWEEGRAEPKTDTMMKIAKHFGISIDALLTRDVTVNELQHFDLFQLGADEHEPSLTLLLDSAFNTIPYLTATEQAVYINEVGKREFTQALPMIQMPVNLLNADLAFEISRANMQTDYGVFSQGNVVFGKSITNTPQNLFPGHAYIVVSTSKVQLLRFVATTNETSWQSDNIHQPEVNIAITDIQAIFKTVSVMQFSNGFPQNRIDRLEEKVSILEQKNKQAHD